MAQPFLTRVVDGENVGATGAEDQEHFDGPGAVPRTETRRSTILSSESFTAFFE